jgi:plasmid stabilization system protein ParE
VALHNIRFSREAERDLNGIYGYVAQDSAYYADKVVDDIYDRIQILLTQPESGRIVPEIGNPLIREVFEHSWRIMYTTEFLPVILILRVVHFAQSFKG